MNKKTSKNINIDYCIANSYLDNVKLYRKSDAIIALLVMIYTIIISFLSGFIFSVLEVKEPFSLIVGIAFLFVTNIPLYILFMKRKQKLTSIGIHLINWKASITMGLIFILISFFLFRGLIVGLINKWNFNSFDMIVLSLLLVFMSALFEDLIMIGYIQTRLYGLIKGDILAVVAGSVIFTFIHLPIMLWLPWRNKVILIMFYMMIHFLLNSIYRIVQSIIPVTALHFSLNYSSLGLFWQYPGDGINSSKSLIVLIFLVIMLILIFKKFSPKMRSRMP